MKLFSIGKYSLPLVFAFLIPIFGAFNMYLSKYLRNNASSHYFVDNSCWIYKKLMIQKNKEKEEIKKEKMQKLISIEKSVNSSID